MSTRTRRLPSPSRAEGSTDDEAARYRRAAEAALEQLDAAIRYLRRLQKRQLAARLERNRAFIVRRWLE